MPVFAPKEWVQSRLDDGYYTPDNAKLFRKHWHPVFVYGTLRDGFYRNRLLADCPKVGNGFTRGAVWELFRTLPSKHGSYPIALSTPDNTRQGRLYGEVYLVPPKLIRELDFIESNGIQYSRINRAIDILHPTSPTVLQAWMYVGIPEAWRPHQKTGLIPLPCFKRKNSPYFNYYVFRKNDAT